MWRSKIAQDFNPCKQGSLCHLNFGGYKLADIGLLDSKMWPDNNHERWTDISKEAHAIDVDKNWKLDFGLAHCAQ